jgi:hypothetical protein
MELAAPEIPAEQPAAEETAPETAEDSTPAAEGSEESSETEKSEEGEGSDEEESELQTGREGATARPPQDKSAESILDGILPEPGTHTCATAPSVRQRGFPDFTSRVF